jgi:hypothetical protein
MKSLNSKEFKKFMRKLQKGEIYWDCEIEGRPIYYEPKRKKWYVIEDFVYDFPVLISEMNDKEFWGDMNEIKALDKK